MTQECDVGGFVLAAWAYEALDAAVSVDEAERVLAQAEAARAYARHTQNPDLEADADKIRFYAQLRLHELRARRKGEPT